MAPLAGGDPQGLPLERPYLTSEECAGCCPGPGVRPFLERASCPGAHLTPSEREPHLRCNSRNRKGPGGGPSPSPSSSSHSLGLWRGVLRAEGGRQAQSEGGYSLRTRPLLGGGPSRAFGGAPANVCAHMWVRPQCGKRSPLEDSQGWLSSGMFTRKEAQPCLLAQNWVSFLQKHSDILRESLLLGMENVSFQWTRAWTGDQPSLSNGAVAWKERPLRGHSSLSERAAIPWSVGWAAPRHPAWCPAPLTWLPRGPARCDGDLDSNAGFLRAHQAPR